MNIKKFISLFLTICMVLCMVSTVSADVVAGQTVLLNDNFSSGIAKWTVSNSKYFTGNTGKLVYKNYVGSTFDDTVENELVVENGNISFEMKANNPVGFSAKVRAKGKTADLITFDYSSNKVKISRVENGSVTTLLKEGNYKLSNNVIYNVTISFIGTEITVEINNQEVIKATEKKLTEGNFGFTARKGQYEIDNFVVHEKKNEKPSETVTITKTTKIYVAPDGNDETGDGSYEKPFATMAKARDLTVRAKANYLPVEVIFKEGEYRIDKVTSFDSSTSGSEAAPVTYRADDGAKVVFNGATVLDHTKFEPITDEKVKAKLYDEVKDKVFQLDLAAQGFTREELDFISINKEIPTTGAHGENLRTVNFFLNDRLQRISRWPNSGFVTFDKCVQGSTSVKDPYNGGRIYFSNPEPLRWVDAKEAYVEGLMYSEWYTESIPIKGINADEMTIDLYRYGVRGLRNGHEYCVKNLVEEIDIPGEWYIDFDTMMLYYYPERAFREEDVFEVSTLKQAFVSLNNASFINFKDLTFKNSLGMVQSVYDESGKMLAFGRSNNRKEQFENYGGGIEFGNNSHDITIDGCTFKDINGTGVRSIGYKSAQTFWPNMNIYVQNCNFYRCSEDAIRVGTGDAPTLQQGNFNILNNFFYECDVMYGNNYCCGYTIKNNLHVRVFNHAIRIDGAEYIVENNEIAYGNYGMSDMGAIYNGRNTSEYGSSISRNLITNYGPAPVEMRSYPAGAIYLDDVVGGMTITQNMSMARNKNYQSTALIYGGGPDVHHFGNISINANRGFVIQNRVGAYPDMLVKALEPTRTNLSTARDTWMAKYPQVERQFEWMADTNFYDAQVQFYDNLASNCDVATYRTQTDLKPYLTGRVDDAHIIDDLSIYVDPENYDFRLKMEAVEKYNLPLTLPNEQNLDINTIGLQREMVYNEDLINFEITYPLNGQTVDYANKLTLAWQSSDAATAYEYMVATDEKFNNIVAQGKTMDTSADITTLEGNKTYYFKVKAMSESRKHGYELENKNGVIKFMTPNVYHSNTGLLEKTIGELEIVAGKIVEGSQAGQAKFGTKEKAQAVINEAKALISSSPAQSVVDDKTSEVADFIKKLDAFKNTGYTTLNINKKTKWINTAELNVMDISNGTATFETLTNNNITLNEILPNTEVVKIKYSISNLTGWHALGLRRQTPEKEIYSDDCYYIIVKKDVFELQKKGLVLKTEPNDGIVVEGKENEVTLGAVTIEGGVNLYAEINGKVIFDYLDTSETMDLAGMFTIRLPKETSITISKADNVPTELFQPSQKIIEEATLGSKTVYDTTSDGFEFVNGTFADYKYDRQPEGAKEYISTDVGAEARWSMETKGETTFEVYYFHHGAEGNDNNAEIIISGKDGTYRKTVDFSIGGEEYKYLGTFKFVSDNNTIGRASLVIKGSGNGKLPVSTIYIRETTNDKPDMFKPENQ